MAALIIFGVDDFKVIDKNGIKSKKIRTIIQPEHFDGHGQDNYGGDNVDNDGGDNVVDDVVKCLIKNGIKSKEKSEQSLNQVDEGLTPPHQFRVTRRVSGFAGIILNDVE